MIEYKIVKECTGLSSLEFKGDNGFGPEFQFGDTTFLVLDQDAADKMVQSYRDAAIDAAYNDISRCYQLYFDFNGFAEDSFQSVYDIYDEVFEMVKNDKTYYICLR